MESAFERNGELSLKHMLITIMRFWKFLLSKWIILCIFGFIGCVAGIVYEWLQEPRYEAILSFSTQDDQSGGGGGLQGIAQQFGFNIGGLGGVFSGDNILTLVESRRMITATLLTPVNYNGSQQSLLNIYLDANHYTEMFKKNDSLKNLSFPVTQDSKTYSRLQDSILFLIADNLIKGPLKVDKPDKNIQVFTIDCITNNEFFSAEFVKQLIAKVADFYVETKTKQSQATVNIIQDRADSVKRAFDAALEGRAYLSDANINSAFQVPQVSVEKKQTDITVLGTAYGEILKNLELAKFNLLNSTPYIQIIDEPVMPLKIVKTGRLFGGIIGGFIFGMLGIAFLIVREIIRAAKKYKI